MTALAATQSRLATGGRDDWATPPQVLERVRLVGPIWLDPCSACDNPTEAEAWIYPPGDGLSEMWIGRDDGLVYVNPPYSEAKAWADKITYEARQGGEIVTLVAARPDARWFFSLVWNSAQAVCFWKGRLRFVGAPSSAPFPSAVVYHGPRPWRFEEAFASAGRVLRLR